MCSLENPTFMRESRSVRNASRLLLVKAGATPPSKSFLLCFYPVVAVVHAGKVERWEKTASREARNTVHVLEKPSREIAKAERQGKTRENRDAFSLFFTASLPTRVGKNHHQVESMVRSNRDAVALETVIPQQPGYPKLPHDTHKHQPQCTSPHRQLKRLTHNSRSCSFAL